VYWRGRVWPCFNYLVYLGLRRYRFDEEAAWLAERGLEMFRRGWSDRRCYENFSQHSGDGGDSVDAEPFYTWGTLLPMIADLEVIGTDPWDGTCFGCAGDDRRSAVGYVAGRALQDDLGPSATGLSRDGVPLLSAGLRGRFRRLEVGDGRLSVELPSHDSDFTLELALPAAAGAVVALDGTQAPDSRLGPLRLDGNGVEWLPIRLPRSSASRRLEIIRR
jgi:putative isomerase